MRQMRCINFIKKGSWTLLIELNILRDSIIYSDKLDAEEGLNALLLFNNLYSLPNDLSLYIRKQDDDFAWFTFSPREQVEKLVSEFGGCINNCNMIRETYNDIESNVFVQYVPKNFGKIKKAIKFLNLNKNKERVSILFKRLHSNKHIDNCLRNKDVYFIGYKFNNIEVV